MIKHWELKLARKYTYKLTIDNDPNSLEFDTFPTSLKRNRNNID